MHVSGDSAWYYLSFWHAQPSNALLSEAEMEEFQQRELKEALPLPPLPEEDLPF